MFARLQQLFGIGSRGSAVRQGQRRVGRGKVSTARGGKVRLEKLESRQLMAADFDNDGFDDLVVGAASEDAGAVDAGAVMIAYGATTGLGTRNQYLDQATLGGVNNAGDWFGSVFATGDFDRDGYDDLAIGAPGETIGGLANAGMVYVIYGSAIGLDPATAVGIHQNSPFVPGLAEAGDTFGKALAAGDFDFDGYDDLAIGVPGETVGGLAGAGAVNVMYGGAGGVGAANQFWTQDSPGILDFAEAGDGFGSSLTTGDYDNDNFDDLVIGVMNEDVGAVVDAGAVNVIYGSGARLASGGNQFIHQNSPLVPDVSDPGDQFSFSLATGDFNNDGFDDLTVGVPYEDVGLLVNSGVVHVMYGGGAGVGAAQQLWSQDSVGILDASESGDLFGWSLVAGDFDNDGRDDLAIGVMGEDMTVANDGAVQVLFGVLGTGLMAARNSIWFQDAIGVADWGEVDDFFGSAVAAGDFDGDGVDDLAIGVVGEDFGPWIDAGAVEVLYGQAGVGIGPAMGQFFDEFSLGGKMGIGSGFGGSMGRRR